MEAAAESTAVKSAHCPAVEVSCGTLALKSACAGSAESSRIPSQRWRALHRVQIATINRRVMHRSPLVGV